MIKLDLINDVLVLKMKKYNKKALLIGAIGLLVLLVFFFIFSDILPKFVSMSFYITLFYIIIYAVGYFIWLIRNTKQVYTTVTLDFNKIILEGSEKLVLKHEGLAYVCLDFDYHPDIYVDFIYNEEVHYKFMIHKNSYPQMKSYLIEHRINYEEINNS